MTIVYRHLKAREFPEVRQRYRDRDVMLYALSLGLGRDPLDERALPFVFEGRPGGLRVLPTMAAVLGYPGFWVREPDTGIDWVHVVHGEQTLQVHAPLPAAGGVVGHNRITRVIDKGEGRGALIAIERRLESPDGHLYATLQQVLLCRRDGGFSQQHGGQTSDPPLDSLVPVPTDRPPDLICDLPTLPESALLYRLLADLNPLHADPAVARDAGFPRPILHGLATFGLAAYALIRECGQGDATRLRSLAVRFAAPVLPGETLRIEVWRAQSALRFRSRVLERDCIVLSHGSAHLTDG
ncbi:MAG: MaoC family dehydratase N-terminal domain-containing protein [Pseudomonadota bacterium]|nr:MaoC family dehydratase N-terminal domain-containing protein [Pseudomonadota bacterium]